MEKDRVSARIDRSVVEQVEELSSLYNVNKSTIYELLLSMSLTYFDYDQIGMELGMFEREDRRKKIRQGV